jgi:hypothetical protein
VRDANARDASDGDAGGDAKPARGAALRRDVGKMVLIVAVLVAIGAVALLLLKK